VKIDPALNAANHFLLGTFEGPRAPDVVVPFRENTIGSALKTAFGEHGGLNWGAQHVPLILSGAGVAPGRVSPFPARLVDIAPTVLRILGLPAGQMDGVVLADGLAYATAQDIAAQTALTPSLTAVQAALAQQSANNIAEDEHGSLAPPPVNTPHP
jgi:hypothetical protein